LYYARDSESGETFAVPVTITNRGARDVVVTALDMHVVSTKAGAAPVLFSSVYIGTGSNPAKDKQPFTPLSIPGRGSYTGMVLFYPADSEGKAPHLAASGGESYRFCIGTRTETSQDYPWLDALSGTAPSATSFESKLPWFAAKDLDANQTIRLQIGNARRHELQRNERGTVPACD